MMPGGMGIVGPLMMVFMLVLLVIFIVAIVWITMYVLKRNKTDAPPMPSAPHIASSARPYEQGYQPPQRTAMDQAGNKPYFDPPSQYEQPQVSYPSEQEMPPQQQ